MSPRPRFRFTAGALLSALVVAALLAVALMIVFLKKPPEREIAAQEKEYPVRVAIAEPALARDTLELPARVEPVYDAILAAEKPGRIESIAVERGASVTAGQALARIDARAWEARRRQAEVERDIAAREMERWNELKAAGAVSGSDFDAIRARLDRAEAALEDARVQTDQCIVRAPAAGVISDRYAEPGEHANEGKALLRLTDISTVKIVADAPEREIGAVAVGESIEFTADRLPDRVFTAAVRFVSPTARRETLTYRVEAVAPNPDGALSGGTIVRLRWPRRSRPDWVALPLPAVIPRRGEHIVFVADAHDRAVRRQVTLEYVAGARAVVSAGVAPGERVIVEGQRTLTDGARLKALADAAPAVSP